MELESQLEAIRGRGLNVAALSYDPVEVLRDFARRRGIRYPLLSDPGSEVIRRYGILNPEYPPGSVAHGVPYPITIVTDEKGIVRQKLHEDTYAERRTAASFLVLAGEAPRPGATENRTDHFLLRVSASNREVTPGNRVTLVLDFEMREERHAYAPGAEGYRTLRLRLDPNPLVTFHDPVYPPARRFEFKPLRETVPVFEGRFRLLQDVTLADGRAFAELLKEPEPTLALRGTLDYQVCSETVCYPPASLPLSWSFRVLPLDRERAPETIRRQSPGP